MHTRQHGTPDRNIQAPSCDDQPGNADITPDTAASISVVIPVYNAIHYLPTTIQAVLAAASAYGPVEIVVVDNGSTDGSAEYLETLRDRIYVHTRPDATIAALRNYGATTTTGEYISFLDADCVIPQDYFFHATAVLRATNASATGSMVALPPRPNWIERVWYQLHHSPRQGPVPYLNSGNFFITRAAFLSSGGFDETLRTGEDSELGLRLNRSGHMIFHDDRVAAIHLDFPKTIRAHYRRNVWHGLGMFGTVTWHTIDKPTAMTVTHLFFSLAGLVLPFVLGPRFLIIPLALAMQLVVPGLTVVYRSACNRSLPPITHAVLLYWLYYMARIHALLLIVLGRSYVK